MSFDFKEWMDLARNNPGEFDRKRVEAIEDLIAQAPQETQQKLRCLQWRIDMERRRCGNTMAACTRVYSMMWNSVYNEGGLLDKLNLLLKVRNNEAATYTPPKTAKIIAFRS